jgi:hypothetical protein
VNKRWKGAFVLFYFDLIRQINDQRVAILENILFLPGIISENPDKQIENRVMLKVEG